MSHNGRSFEGGTPAQSPELRGQAGLPAVNTPLVTTAGKGVASRYADLQSAVRFPIKLPVFVKSKAGQSQTETENISANGVLFQLDSAIPVGSPVDFTISLPAEIVGADTDVQLDCRGRVARSFADGPRVGVGVVIDEYHFKRGEN
jgi:hypothetical protein